MKPILYSTFFILSFVNCQLLFSQDLPHLTASTQQYLWKQKNLYNNTNKILPECVYRMDNNGRIYLASFIQVGNNINENDLRALDIKIGSKAKNIWTAFVPIENVEAFTHVSGIKFIDVDRPVGMNMDSAKIATRVDSVHAGINLPQAYTGKNVVVGIIDIGFDYTHPAVFDTSYSRLRLKSVWEQKGIGTPPANFPFGAEYSDSISIFNKQTDNTGQSHGTHVSGIAAGSGYGTTNGDNIKYRGMAFESDIVYVGILPEVNHWVNTGLTDFADGMNYIYDYADSQSKPAVANLSWGPPIGPHDGLGLFSQACDNMTGAGKIFSISAGNNAGKKVHLQKIFTPTDTIVKTFLNFHSSLPQKKNWADIWGDTSANFCIQFELYNGSSPYTSSSTYCIDDQTNQINLIGTNGDTCKIILTTVSSDINGKSHMLIDAYNKTSNLLLLNLMGTAGKIDAWQGYVLNSTGYYASFSRNGMSFATDGDDVMACSDAASANSAIAVGAYNSKVSYVNLLGNTVPATGETYGDITTFSSHGPTADGRTKPNITAPGSRIVSSINSYSSVYNSYATDQYLSPLDGRTYKYGAIQGTSMSSPACAGIIALLLEADPTLTPLQVQTILYETAIQDSFTGVIPSNGDNVWGWGKINAYKAIYYTLNFVGIYHDMNSPLQALFYPNPSNGNYTIELNAEKNETISISLFDINGKLISQNNWNVIQGTNTIHPTWNNLATGIYILKIASETGEMNVKLEIQ